MLRLSEVMVDGVRSPALQGGPATSEEAVVFVHGNPGFSRDWEDLLERVGEFSRCLAPDMPGFGQADRPEEFNYTVSGYARHLGGLLTKLQVQRAHLVLHDFGGPWGLAWALANPTALASLTLINTGVLPDYHWHYLARVWRAPMLGEIFMASTTRLGFHLLLKHGTRADFQRRLSMVCLTISILGRSEQFYGFIVPPITLQKWPNALATFFGVGPARRWSSGDTPIRIFRSATPNASATIFPEHKSLCSKAAAIGPMPTIPKGSQRFCCHF